MKRGLEAFAVAAMTAAVLGGCVHSPPQPRSDPALSPEQPPRPRLFAYVLSASGVRDTGNEVTIGVWESGEYVFSDRSQGAPVYWVGMLTSEQLECFKDKIRSMELYGMDERRYVFPSGAWTEIGFMRDGSMKRFAWDERLGPPSWEERTSLPTAWIEARRTLANPWPCGGVPARASDGSTYRVRIFLDR
ncbi:MAG: hypothetical protein IBJ11_09850 [Phycisphaerales bacterium]|nr:hypothetical protein [Phycisphaerales bacterium]